MDMSPMQVVRCKVARDGIGTRTAKPRESASQTKPNLHRDGDRVRRARAHVRGLREAAVREHIIVSLSIVRSVLVVERLDVTEKRLALVALLPARRELVGGARYLVLEAGADDALRGTREGREEIGGCLARGTVEAHLDEELLGVFARTEVDLAALVQDDDLVEHL